MSSFCVLSECCQSVCEYECGVLYGTGYDYGSGSRSACGSWCLCWLLNSALLKAKADFLSAIMMRTFCARTYVCVCDSVCVVVVLVAVVVVEVF